MTAPASGKKKPATGAHGKAQPEPDRQGSTRTTPKPSGASTGRRPSAKAAPSGDGSDADSSKPEPAPHLDGMGAIVTSDGVGFRVWAPHATAVTVKGSFNDWSDTADSLAVEGNGYWSPSWRESSRARSTST